jgi:DNA polymerase III sliding clamp (beta) subunit (PCNA family)
LSYPSTIIVENIFLSEYYRDLLTISNVLEGILNAMSLTKLEYELNLLNVDFEEKMVHILKVTVNSSRLKIF